MATKSKHALRSKRSNNQPKDFTDFHRKATYAKAKKEQKKSLAQMLGDVIHRTTNK